MLKELPPTPDNPAESKNTLKSEHLKDKRDAIIACVGTPQQFKKTFKKRNGSINATKESPNYLNVNFYENPEQLLKQDFKNSGRKSFVISTIDNKDKISQLFFDCTRLIISGRDKETGENISFLSHENPNFFLKSAENREAFINALQQRLKELRDKSIEGTIDAIIIGGDSRKNEPDKQKRYRESIKLLSEEVMNVLGFEPVVITGPKTVRYKTIRRAYKGHDDIYYFNKYRKIFIHRPNVGKVSTESFLPSDIENQEKKWWPKPKR